MAIDKSLKSLKIILLLLLGALFFIWPIPHTITLRYLFLILIFLISGFLAFKKGIEITEYKLLKIPVLIFLVFLAWTFFVAFFLSDYTVESLKEIKSDLITNIFIFLAAAFTAIAARDDRVLSARNILLLFFAVCILHLVYFDFQGFYVLFTKGYLPTRITGVKGFTAGHIPISYIAVFALTFILAEGFIRMIGSERFLNASAFVLVISFFIVLSSLCIAGARNAVVMSTLLFLFVLAIYLYENKPNLKKVAVLLFACLSFFILWYFHVKLTPEWKSVISVMSTAMDTEENKCWLDCKKFPIKAGPLEYSVKTNYHHIAMFKEGFLFVVEKPLGRGFAENAYGIAVSNKYKIDAFGRFSHSGVIDLAIGTGIPGLLLFYTFLLSIFVISFKVYRAARGFNAFLLFLIVIGFGVRMLVDSILRDHILQQNFFLFGSLSIFMIQELKDYATLKSNPSPPRLH